jgi:hypothetical protein
MRYRPDWNEEEKPWVHIVECPYRVTPPRKARP